MKIIMMIIMYDGENNSFSDKDHLSCSAKSKIE